MKSPFEALLQIPVGLIETGLLAAGAALRTVQQAVGTLAGQPEPEPLRRPPLEGPQDVESAVREFANRLARTARFTPWDTSELGAATREVLDAARFSFQFVDWKDPRNLALPAQMALAFGNLLVDQGLRGLVTYEVVGAQHYRAFMADAFEMFTEIQIFVGLEYSDLIEKYRARLERAPHDQTTRRELGRTLVKCGQFDEAARLLVESAQDPSCRPIALHEAAVAYYRAGKFEQAARTGIDALTADSGNERARAFLWLTAQRMGGYPAFVPAPHRMEMKVGFDQPTVEFEDIAVRIGMDKTSAGRGLAIFDYNNDGYLDVLIAAAHGGCTLYRNNGDGTFTDVSVGSGIETCVNGFAMTVGDYNNDGYADVWVTRLGFFGGEGQLYRNNGDGTFTDVTAEAGLKAWGPAFSASWVDYNCDGHLDLFICNNLGGLFDRKTRNRLFRNNGDGTFTEVTGQAGLTTVWPTIGAAWGDYNNDGYPDLFVSNALGRSQLFRNNGDGTFTDVSREAGVDSLIIGSTTFWWDYDNDGWLDIMQFAWSDHENVVHTMRHGEAPPNGNLSRVYHNNRDGSFTLRNRDIGIDECWGTMSGNAGDFNNDGYLDLVLGNGSPRMDRMEPLVLLESDGVRFRNVTFAAGLPYTGKGHGANMADLFGDGRLCVLVASGGAYPADLLTAGVYRPTRLPGNYLNVRLVGVTSNRSAIGARISLEAGGRRQHREISGGTNFGCLPFEQHFGLADLTAVDAIEIRWPSGLRQRFENLPANQTLEFTEGLDGWADVYAKLAKQ